MTYDENLLEARMTSPERKRSYLFRVIFLNAQYAHSPSQLNLFQQESREFVVVVVVVASRRGPTLWGVPRPGQ